MTSRASTSFFSRRLPGRPDRNALDLAMVAAFALPSAPFLLKSLYGGSRSAKRELLERLQLPDRALPHTGGWKADVGLLTLLADHIFEKKPSTIVEFGAGATTLVISRALDLAGVAKRRFVSFEQDQDFCARTAAWLDEFGVRSDIRRAALVPSPGGWPGLWYDHGRLAEPIDLLLIDGPNWTIHPFTRGAAETLFDKVRIGGTVMLDDAARPGERIIARRWRRNWPNFSFELRNVGSKGTLVGRRLR